MRSMLILAAAAALMTTPSLAAADTAPPSAAQAEADQPKPVTDGELAAFAEARAEIEPLTPQLSGTEAERATAIAQMRATLAENNLTGERYNEIVAAVRADPELAQRLADLSPETHEGDAS